MALKWLRDNLRHLKFVLWGVVAVFVLLVFVDWGGGGPSGAPGARDAAVRIGDRAVSEQEFVEELRRMNQRYSRQFGDQWNEIQKQVNLPQETVGYFIMRELQLAEADDAGLVVSSEELRDRILSDPLFQRESGGFIGADRYERVIRSYFRMTPQQFESWYADNILLAKLNTVLRQSVYVSEFEVEERFRRQSEVADFNSIQLRYEPHLAEVELSEPALRAHFEADSEEYRRPEQRVVRYLVVETSRLRRLLPAEDAELEAYYEQHRGEFTEEEQAHARHILFRVAPGAGPVDRSEAELRANSVAQIAKSGADFGELAAIHSEDPGSKDNGGDLGWFGRGQMVREFENAVWDAKPGDVLGPVESQFGFHIIRVEGFKPQRQQPFDEVREQVRFRYLEGQAAAEAEVRAAELIRRLASENPDTDEAWQKIADEDEAVVLNVSPAFAGGETIPGTGGGSELADEAFQAKVGKIGGPRAMPRGWMVWQLSQIQAAGVPPFEDVRAEVEQRLRRERALEATLARGAELAQRWRAGVDADALADEYGGTHSSSEEHRWGGSVGSIGGSAALDEAVFAAAEGDVVGPVNLGTRGVVVAHVQRLQPMNLEELADQRDSVRSRLVDERSQQLLQSILNERRRDTVVTVNNEFMERFAPSS
jgi:peptidyl-prolyl cis-trans isomerase D